MKVRESGMPPEAMWQSFFDPENTLSVLGLTCEACDVVDLGCGYGTFTAAAAKRANGVVHAFDIAPAMIDETKRKAEAAHLSNIRYYLRDFLVEGTGLPDSSVDFVMIFNTLHAEEPLRLLRESRRILADGGKVGIVHWSHDPETPRGPPMDIRPKPVDCQRWAREVGFGDVSELVNLPPYHYGLVAQKRGAHPHG